MVISTMVPKREWVSLRVARQGGATERKTLSIKKPKAQNRIRVIELAP
jgi:hypothetical protein